MYTWKRPFSMFCLIAPNYVQWIIQIFPMHFQWTNACGMVWYGMEWIWVKSNAPNAVLREWRNQYIHATNKYNDRIQVVVAITCVRTHGNPIGFHLSKFKLYRRNEEKKEKEKKCSNTKTNWLICVEHTMSDM